MHFPTTCWSSFPVSALYQRRYCWWAGVGGEISGLITFKCQAEERVELVTKDEVGAESRSVCEAQSRNGVELLGLLTWCTAKWGDNTLQRAGGWSVVSHLVSFGSGGLRPPTDTWRTALSSWVRQSATLRTSTCEISHMVTGGESSRSRGGGIFTFSARVWIFKGKKK